MSGSATSGKGKTANILSLVGRVVSMALLSTPLLHESSHTGHRNEWAWLCFDKTLFTKGKARAGSVLGATAVDLWFTGMWTILPGG